MNADQASFGDLPTGAIPFVASEEERRVLSQAPKPRKRRSDAGKPRAAKVPPPQSPLRVLIEDVVTKTSLVDSARVQLANAQEELHEALDALKGATSSHVDEP